MDRFTIFIAWLLFANVPAPLNLNNSALSRLIILEGGVPEMKAVSELGERELLALAISSEQEDGRVYLDICRRIATELSRQSVNRRKHGG